MWSFTWSSVSPKYYLCFFWWRKPQGLLTFFIVNHFVIWPLPFTVLCPIARPVGLIKKHLFWDHPFPIVVWLLLGQVWKIQKKRIWPVLLRPLLALRFPIYYVLPLPAFTRRRDSLATVSPLLIKVDPGVQSYMVAWAWLSLLAHRILFWNATFRARFSKCSSPQIHRRKQ